MADLEGLKVAKGNKTKSKKKLVIILSVVCVLLAGHCHNIGTVLLFRRKYGYAILKMLKSI